MISNEEKREATSEGLQQLYLAVKTLLTLLRGITFKHHAGFYCLNCFHSFTTDKNFESHKIYVKIKIFAM